MNHLFFSPNFVNWGTALGRFSQCFRLFFRRLPTIVPNIFTQNLTWKAGGNTSQFAKNVDLASLQTNVDELHKNEFKNVPDDSNNQESKVNNFTDKIRPVLVKLQRLVVNDIIKNNLCDKVVINAVSTNKLVKKTDYDANIKQINDKIQNHNKLLIDPDKNLTDHLLMNDLRKDVNIIS